MSRVTVVWSMVASACLTLAGMHLLVWCRQRAAWGNVLFGLSAVATAAMAGCELWMMRAESPGEWGLAGRWMHVPIWVLFLSLVGFVRVYLRAGRVWLAWTAVGVRTLSLLLNFLFTPNLNYREITGLRHISFLGESVAVAEGVPNPWMLIAQLSLVLLLTFVVDATVSVWRRGDRRAAIQIGFNMVFFVLMATAQSILILWGFVQAPIMPSVFYLGIVVAMACELSRDALRAAQLAHDLSESEHRMTLAAGAANLGIWTRDLERNEVWASDEWRALFGFAKSDPLDLDRFLERLHPDDREAFRQAWERAIEDGGSCELEYRVVPPDGRLRWIASRGRVEANGAGKPALVRGVFIDITDRKAAELEAAQHRTELAHLTRVTTLSELSGSLAHELNQPLAIILSNAQAAQRLLVLDPPDVAEVRDILTDIVAEDRRAGEVIKRLRTLLKRGETTLTPLSLNEAIEEVLRLVHADLAERGVTVEPALRAGLPPVSGDRVQLQQVVLNLVLNAADAMSANTPGSRRLQLTTARGDGNVRLSARDEGCGLPADVEKLFAPFFTTKPHGLGMGLAICRSIVAAHGGRLWAEPHPERGAVFHLELPASPASPA